MVCATIVLFASANNIEAQVVRNDKTFETTKTIGASNDIPTDYMWKDSKGNEYTIYLHQYTKGEKAGEWTTYVFRISQKTGKNINTIFLQGMKLLKR